MFAIRLATARHEGTSEPSQKACRLTRARRLLSPLSSSSRPRILVQRIIIRCYVYIQWNKRDPLILPSLRRQQAISEAARVSKIPKRR